MKNKIGWCNTTWNPVWGCRNHCEYCYARKIAKRFYKKIYNLEFNYYAKNTPSWAWTGDYLQNLAYFKPTFLVSQFNKKLPKKPQRIFVGSMSEIYYWEDEWIEKVIEKVKQYPQHTFQFLTKHPEVYLKWEFPENCWLGVTITDNITCDYLEYQKFKASDQNNIKFVSFEPLLRQISINLQGIDWVIIGAETGSRKGKVIPKLDWVLDIVRYCEHNKIPVYIKDNLVKYYAECRGYKQFPEERGGEKN